MELGRDVPKLVQSGSRIPLHTPPLSRPHLHSIRSEFHVIHRCEGQTYGYQGDNGGWDELGHWDWHSRVAQMIRNLPAIQDTRVQSLDGEDSLEKGVTTHSSILAWRIPWTEEPGGLQPMRSQRVRYSLVTKHDTCQQQMRTCYVAQGSLLNALWWPKWERNPKKAGYMYTHSWFTLLYCSN